MSKPLDELYFNWLYSQVGDTRIKNPNRTFWRLLKKLYTKEFVWFVANDDNRIADGRELRYEFVEDEGLTTVDPGWINLGCSMLEMLVGLSRQLAFQDEGEPRIWFWELMQNIGLDNYTDAVIFSDRTVDEILDRIIYRTYDPSGEGGLFPLARPEKDQRTVEIWYQANAYLLETT